MQTQHFHEYKLKEVMLIKNPIEYTVIAKLINTCDNEHWNITNKTDKYLEKFICLCLYSI